MRACAGTHCINQKETKTSIRPEGNTQSLTRAFATRLERAACSRQANSLRRPPSKRNCVKGSLSPKSLDSLLEQRGGDKHPLWGGDKHPPWVGDKHPPSNVFWGAHACCLRQGCCRILWSHACGEQMRARINEIVSDEKTIRCRTTTNPHAGQSHHHLCWFAKGY